MSAGLPMHSSIGPYRVIDHVGAGGMGTVYRVSHRATGKVAAAKVMTGGGTTPRALERFRNEARILQALSHPSIAAMYEFLEVNGAPCLVMEYVDGDTLEQLIRTRGPFPVQDALRIFAALTDAVGYIHQRGIVHRDLKTTNVKVDTLGAVKLLDFGIAVGDGSPRLTSTGNVVGTLMSLAPEQLRTGRAEPRSDLWALGIVLYELLTGRPPFDGAAPGFVGERIMRGEYTPASTLRPELPRDVDRIIGRCLKVRLEDRYATAEALLTDLRALQSGEKPLGRRPCVVRPPAHERRGGHDDRPPVAPRALGHAGGDRRRLLCLEPARTRRPPVSCVWRRHVDTGRATGARGRLAASNRRAARATRPRIARRATGARRERWHRAGGARSRLARRFGEPPTADHPRVGGDGRRLHQRRASRRHAVHAHGADRHRGAADAAARGM
ncbi:MAG: serine/threonine protein kinase [Gemmatimonadetes bacterium]|nr:serine/threonine protein kinase [Gemmatimonadota bacterium]